VWRRRVLTREEEERSVDASDDARWTGFKILFSKRLG
jgi:hypothetical protein